MMRRIAAAALVMVALAPVASAQVDLSVAGCPVTSDVCSLGGVGNGNGSLDPGETGAITLSLINSGRSDANNVQAQVSTTTPGVTISQPNASFGTILASATKAGTPAIALSVADTVACGTLIQLDVRITSDEGPFSGSCNVQIPVTCTPCVPGPAVNQAACAHADTCSVGGPGNANGSPDPGESVNMTLSLTNTGTTGATNVTATVNTATPGVSITQPNAAFGNIAQGATVAGFPTIDYTVDINVACGTMIDFLVDVRSTEGTWTTGCQVQVPVNCTPCAIEPQLVVSQCQSADSCALGGSGNGNGSVDPGESAQTTVSITNSGAADATNVVLDASTGTPGITITQSTVNFGTVAQGATVAGPATINYTVDASVACGTSILLQFNIRSDQKGFADNCDVVIPVNCTPCVAAPNLSVLSCNIATDVCSLGGGGNGNGQADPGEAMTVTLELQNTGLAQATNVSATVTSPTPGVNMTQGATTIGTMAASSSASGTPTIDWTLAGAVGCGTALNFDVRITSDQGNFSGNCVVNVPANCTECGTTGTCLVANLTALSRLEGVKAAPAATFRWTAGGGGEEYHLNAVTEKTDLTNCTSPCTKNPKQSPLGMGELRCSAADPAVTCSDLTAISDPRPLLYYQALAACGAAASDEGPM